MEARVLTGCRMEAAGAGLKMCWRAQAIHEKRLQAIEAYEAQIAECEKVLQRVDNPTHRALIRALYVEQMPIWRAAQVTHMSEATAKRIKADYEKREHF